MKTTLTVLAVLCMATIANAGINVTYTSTPLAGNLVQYTVHLIGDNAADMPSAWDGTFTGPLNQFMVATVLTTPTLTIASALGADLAADTHFMVYDKDIQSGRSPSESATMLEGAIAVPKPLTMDTILAQLVMPVGGQATMVGEAANATGSKFAINTVIPEPATLSLLGLGALALRRRK